LRWEFPCDAYVTHDPYDPLMFVRGTRRRADDSHRFGEAGCAVARMAHIAFAWQAQR